MKKFRLIILIVPIIATIAAVVGLTCDWFLHNFHNSGYAVATIIWAWAWYLAMRAYMKAIFD